MAYAVTAPFVINRSLEFKDYALVAMCTSNVDPTKF